MLLAINTTIVMSGVIVFLIVTLILVGMLLFAKAKLTPKGEVKVDINHGRKGIGDRTGVHAVGHPWKQQNLPPFGLWR